MYAVQGLTERLRALGRAGHGGMPEIMGQAVAWRERLLEVDGSPLVHHRLRSALAEMHLLAGWACHDMNLPNVARYHYSRAMTLAVSVDDRPPGAPSTPLARSCPRPPSPTPQ